VPTYLSWTHCHSLHSSNCAVILSAPLVLRPTHQGTFLTPVTRQGLVPRSGSFWATLRRV
jgi:hypothetical protein